MSIAGTIDAPLDLFGGLVTDMAAADLPQGVSPDCQDVAFLSGGVKTRPGLAPVFSPIVSAGGGNPTVNYLKTYTQPNLVKRCWRWIRRGRCGEKILRACCRRLPRDLRRTRRRVLHRCLGGNIWPCTTATLAWTCRGNTTGRISTA